MYNPSVFKVEDIHLLYNLIQDYPFGTFISRKQDELEINHYPFLIEKNKDQFDLYTHLAKSNHQYESSEGILVFQGPHGYISPKYYKNLENVPTWNYTSVHIHCKIEIIENRDQVKILFLKLLEKSERDNGTTWTMNVSDEFYESLIKGIVWLKFEPYKIEGKFKLSQNRNQEDLNSVISHLEKRGSKTDLELKSYMELLQSRLG